MIKQESAKADQQKSAAAAVVAAEVAPTKSETSFADFDSDSNDEKSLESLKREMQAECLKESSFELSIEAEEEKPLVEEIKAEEVAEIEEIKAEVELEQEEPILKSESVEIESDEVAKPLKEENEEEIEAPEVEKKEEEQEAEAIEEDSHENAEPAAEVAEEIEEVEEKEEIPEEVPEAPEADVEEKVAEVAEPAEPEEQEIENIIEEIEDDDIPMGEEISEVKSPAEAKEEPEPLKVEEKDSVESVEIVEIKDDDDKVDPSVIVIEENDDTISEDNQPLSSDKNENIHDEDDDVVVETKIESPAPRESGRKVSTDDELFEDAKEHMDDMKSDDVEQNTEPESASQTITIIDTDDDSPFEVKTGRTKRDYSRRKQESSHSIDKRSEETTSSDDVVGSISSRLRLKDRERSESPYVEEDSGEPAAKSKRRYSSTPNIDSLPNSPASSDDREYRGWKKSIMIVYNRLLIHKCASLFTKPISEDHAPNYRSIVLQPMDLQTLKRNIDSGSIRTTMEFRRYVMLLCYNAIFYNCNDDVTCSRAKEMLSDALSLIDDIMDTWKKENEKSASASTSSSSSTTKVVRGRKSNRLMN